MRITDKIIYNDTENIHRMKRAYDSKTELLNENPNPPAMLGRME
ncbi:hypothetical protein CLOSCI_01679 [[Clostridium] scindens ATCC 35704]|nr:hypothetical protein CLOSCI_01679 [[Clostridium] scindens ATCC 35704]